MESFLPFLSSLDAPLLPFPALEPKRPVPPPSSQPKRRKRIRQMSHKRRRLALKQRKRGGRR